jgi:hypothetical protein
MNRIAVVLFILFGLGGGLRAQLSPTPGREGAAKEVKAVPSAPWRANPFEVIAEDPERIRMRVHAEVLAELASREAAILGPVRVYGGEDLDLDVARLPAPYVPGAPVLVDGELQAPDFAGTTSLWVGTVAGEPDSEVFLALSNSGSRGWIRRGNEFQHLLARPRAGGNWSGADVLLVRDAELRARDLGPEFVCATDDLTRLGPRLRGALPVPGSSSGSIGMSTQAAKVLEVEIAVETDYQFYQLFSSLPAATAYIEALFGAVSMRYRQQIKTVLSMSYLALYTTNSDPWLQQDVGGNCIDVLYEFQNAWNSGGAPVLSDLYHLVSGANLGCGVAWLPGLCDQIYGFAVSGNVNGQLPFPVGQGPLNWDFMVFAHELGHNFGSPHTHSYCPPLDECAPAGYFGACQTQQTCTTSGTVMSYCHLCSGGLSNITTYFHPANVVDMRAQAESSGCVDPYVRRP